MHHGNYIYSCWSTCTKRCGLRAKNTDPSARDLSSISFRTGHRPVMCFEQMADLLPFLTTAVLQGLCGGHCWVTGRRRSLSGKWVWSTWWITSPGRRAHCRGSCAPCGATPWTPCRTVHFCIAQHALSCCGRKCARGGGPQWKTQCLPGLALHAGEADGELCLPPVLYDICCRKKQPTNTPKAKRKSAACLEEKDLTNLQEKIPKSRTQHPRERGKRYQCMQSFRKH